MKRYKIGVCDASFTLGKAILKSLIDYNLPYSFIRALTLKENINEVKIDDYTFSLNKLSFDSLKDLDFVILMNNLQNKNEYINYLKENNKIYLIVNDYKDSLSMIKKEIIGNNEEVEAINFYGAISEGEEGISELENQYLAYFNNMPMIANIFQTNNQKVPLAFNIIPFKKDNNLNFYISSLYGCAMLMKTRCSDFSLIENIKNNEHIKYYENKLPSILECEGNEFIHIGVVSQNDQEVTLFATYDIRKIIVRETIKEIKERIKNDEIL